MPRRVPSSNPNLPFAIKLSRVLTPESKQFMTMLIKLTLNWLPHPTALLGLVSGDGCSEFEYLMSPEDQRVPNRNLVSRVVS